MSAMKAHLDCLLQGARALNKKHYREFDKIDQEEMPTFIMGKLPSDLNKYKPSEKWKRARQLYLAVDSFFQDLERAKFSYERYMNLLKMSGIEGESSWND